MAGARNEYVADIIDTLALGLAVAANAPDKFSEFSKSNPFRDAPVESEAMKQHKEKINALRWRGMCGGEEGVKELSDKWAREARERQGEGKPC